MSQSRIICEGCGNVEVFCTCKKAENQEAENKASSGEVRPFDALVILRQKVEEFRDAEKEAQECPEFILSGYHENAARLMEKLELKREEMYKALEAV